MGETHIFAALLGALVAAGCTGTVDIDSETTSTSSTTSSTTTESTTETFANTTTTSSKPTTTDMTFIIEGEFGGSTLSLIYLDLSDSSDEELSFGDTITSAEITSSSQTIALPEPDPSLLIEIKPGLSLAIFVPTAHNDSDKDAAYTNGEVINGVGLITAAYIDGELPPETGLVAGWNAVDIGWVEEVDGLFPYPIDEVPLSMNQSPREELRLEIANDVFLPSNDIGLAVLPSALFKESDLSGLIYDDIIGDNATVELDGAPPADHFSDIDLVSLAGEIPLTYADADDSGDFSLDADVVLSAICLDGDPISLFYIAPTTDLQTALQFAMSDDIQVGWNALGTHLNKKGGIEEYMLTHEDLAKLDASFDCQFLD